jgi:hypothetical protein
MLTMQSQYKSKVPNHGKKFKKKDHNSSISFKHIMGVNNMMGKDNAMSTARIRQGKLKGIDSRANISHLKTNRKQGKDSKSHHINGAEGKERFSSGKKKGSTKK